MKRGRDAGLALLVGGVGGGALLLARALSGSTRRRAEAAREIAEARREPAVAGEGGGAGTSKGLSRAFDPLFAGHGHGLPVPYLRALAARESSMDPRNVTGRTRGLLQVVPVVLKDYNERHGTRYGADDLFDPAINVEIATETLRRIVESYRKNHPRVPNLQEDWDNPAFVDLLTFGWNAGYSEVAGVGKVVQFLEAAGIRDITIDVVHEWARGTFGASKHLLNADKVKWSRSVTRLYFAEKERDEREAAARPVA